jgi:tetratricopeptide (TPR) repeat protein
MEEAYAARGVAKRNLNDFEGAVLDYTKALELKPNYGRAYYNRALAYFHLGNEKNGCNDLNTALRLGYHSAGGMIKKLCLGK